MSLNSNITSGSTSLWFLIENRELSRQYRNATWECVPPKIERCERRRTMQSSANFLRMRLATQLGFAVCWDTAAWNIVAKQSSACS